MEKDMHTNNNQKCWGAVLISDEVDFRTRNTSKDNEGHYIMTKESIIQNDITILNVYAP